MGLKPVEAFEKNGERFGTLISGNSGVICFESTTKPEGGDWSQAIMELQATTTKKAAQTEAQKRGISDARLEFGQAPYAVDANGDQVVNPLQQKIAAYRIDIKVTGRLV